MVYIANLDNFIEAAQQLFISSPGDVCILNATKLVCPDFFCLKCSFTPAYCLLTPIVMKYIAVFADSILDKIQAF